MLWLQKHIAMICIVTGALMSLFVFISWGIGYYANALYGMHFDLGSCWTGLGAIATSIIGIAKWIIDSIKNSFDGNLPVGYQSQTPQESENPQKIISRQ